MTQDTLSCRKEQIESVDDYDFRTDYIYRVIWKKGIGYRILRRKRTEDPLAIIMAASYRWVFEQYGPDKQFKLVKKGRLTHYIQSPDEMMTIITQDAEKSPMSR